MEIKLTTGDAADAMDKVVTGEADLAIAGKPETLRRGGVLDAGESDGCADRSGAALPGA